MKKLIFLVILILVMGCSRLEEQDEKPVVFKADGWVEGISKNPLVEKCVFFEEIECLSHEYSDNKIRLMIKNNAGFDMEETSINVEGCVSTNNTVIVLKDGEEKIYAVNCEPDLGKFKGRIRFSYLNAEGIKKNNIGEVIMLIK